MTGYVWFSPPFPGCGHLPVMLNYFMSTADGGNSSSLRKRAWGRGRYTTMNEQLTSYDWD